MISLSILIDFESANSQVLADTVSEHDTMHVWQSCLITNLFSM